MTVKDKFHVALIVASAIGDFLMQLMVIIWFIIAIAAWASGDYDKALATAAIAAFALYWLKED